MPNVRIYYSRFVIYTCEARWKFRSAALIGGGEDYVTLYKRLSRQVLDMYLLRMKEFICSDEDFHSAMEIVKATINHSLLLISSLPGDEVNPKALKSYFRIRFVIE